MMSVRVAVLLLLAPAARGVCVDSAEPLLKVVTSTAEGCFQRCPDLCKPVGALVAQYTADGNFETMKRHVCADPKAFGCMYDPLNAKECGKLLQAAARMGLDLPASSAELEGSCTASEGGKRQACPANQGPEMQVVTRLSPECFLGCPQTCRALERVAQGYAAGGSAESLRDEVCDAREEFSCLFRPGNAAQCRKVLTEAHKIGLELPMTLGAFEARCSPAPNSTTHNGAHDPAPGPIPANGTRPAPNSTRHNGAHDAAPGTVPANGTRPAPDSTRHNGTHEDAPGPVPGNGTGPGPTPVRDSACSSPMMKVVAGLAPQCFKSCSELCEPVEGLVKGYLGKASGNALMDKLCAKEDRFACMYEQANYQECRKVLEGAKKIGLLLPMTRNQMRWQCLTKADGDSAVCPTARNPAVSVIADRHPTCFGDCPDLCGELDVWMTDFVRSGDKAALQRQVCGQQANFSCVLREECEGVVASLLKSGLPVPTTPAALQKQCGTDPTPEAAPHVEAVAGAEAPPAPCAGSRSQLLKVVTNISQACFQQCPQLCQPLDALVTTYEQNGNFETLRREVCASPESFDCIFDPLNTKECGKVLEAAHWMGLELPRSKAELDGNCTKGELTPAACPGSTTPAMRVVTHLAPACFLGCPQTCHALSGIADSFTAGADQGTLKQEVCRAREQFSCLYRPGNTGQCRRVLEEASKIGFSLPTTLAEFQAQCSDAAQNGTGAAGAPDPQNVTNATDPANSTATPATAPHEAPNATNPTGPTEKPQEGVCPGMLATNVVTALAPECFRKCPQLCRPLDSLVKSYKAHASGNVLMNTVCSREQDFACLYEREHAEECLPVLRAGDRLGFRLPLTRKQLKWHCAVKADGDGVCPAAHNPLVSATADRRPECFADCPKACSAVDAWMTGFYRTGDEDALKHQVCRHSGTAAFKCLLRESCTGLLAELHKQRVPVPTSKREFKAMCRKTTEMSDPDGESIDDVEEAVASGEDPDPVCPGNRSSTFKAVMTISPACFEQCPEVCEPLDSLLAQYGSNGNFQSLRARVCARSDAFACLLEPAKAKECGKVLRAAAWMGLDLPRTNAELRGNCSEAAQAPQQACPQSASPLMRLVTDISPECFLGCPQTCRTLEGMVTEYVASGDAQALEGRVCADREEFSCMYRPGNAEACRRVLAKGSALGLRLPLTADDFAGRCAGVPGGAPSGAVHAPSSESVCAGAGHFTRLVVNVSAQCFASCPDLCEPLDALVHQYLANVTRDALTHEACSVSRFQCMYEPANFQACQPVLEAGAKLGVALPMSWDDFQSRCAAAEGSKAAPGCSVNASTPTGLVIEASAACFAQCPGLCGPFQRLGEQYLANATTDALAESVCAAEEHFACLYGADECRGLLAQGSRLGVHLPESGQQLRQRCGARAPAAACPGARSQLSAGLAEASPECFGRCPGLCGAVDEVLSEWAKPSTGPAALRRAACGHAEALRCLLAEENERRCEKVLDRAHKIGLPLQAPCEPSTDLSGAPRRLLRGRDADGRRGPVLV